MLSIIFVGVALESMKARLITPVAWSTTSLSAHNGSYQKQPESFSQPGYSFKYQQPSGLLFASYTAYYSGVQIHKHYTKLTPSFHIQPNVRIVNILAIVNTFLIFLIFIKI